MGWLHVWGAEPGCRTGGAVGAGGQTSDVCLGCLPRSCQWGFSNRPSSPPALGARSETQAWPGRVDATPSAPCPQDG